MNWRAWLPLSLAFSRAARSPTARPRAARGAPERDIGILVFGDHGYHLDYLEAEDYEPPRTREQFIALRGRTGSKTSGRPRSFARQRWRSTGTAPGWRQAGCHRSRARCRPGATEALRLRDHAGRQHLSQGRDARRRRPRRCERFETIFREPLGPLRSWARSSGFTPCSAITTGRPRAPARWPRSTILRARAPFYMDGIIYRVRPPAAQGEVELFVIDTTVLLAGQTVYEDALADDASELRPTRREDPERWVIPEDPARSATWPPGSSARSPSRTPAGRS